MSGPSDPEMAALDVVRRWTRSSSTLQEMRETWLVRPFRDALVAAPRQAGRGAALYMVREQELEPIVSGSLETMDEVYDRLVARPTD